MVVCLCVVVSAVSYYILLTTLHINMDAWFRIGSYRKIKLLSDEGTSSSGTTNSEIIDISSLNLLRKLNI